jgi:periplasmic protein TonB
MQNPVSRAGSTQQNIQFSHFGPLNSGNQSKGALATAIATNIVIAIAICAVSSAAKKTMDKRHVLTELSMAALPKKMDPVRPKVLPPKLPAPPVVHVDPPKIKLPEVKLPDIPKIQPIVMAQQTPILVPAPPKQVQPPPAPKVVNLAQAQAASVINNSPHAAPVTLGQQNNPIAPSNRTSTSAVNLGQRGMPGMAASNTGMGPAATAINLGSGLASSQNMSGGDNAANAIRGVKLGVAGGTGSMKASGAAAVNLGQNTPPPLPKPASPVVPVVKSAPKVLFKPRPEYTAEAIKLHIEGTVSVRLRISTTGAVEVIGVTSDLGHGLGESAVRAVKATRFQPATDPSGQPINWEGIVNVAFQLAG